MSLPEPEEILRDLHSKQPARVSTALAGLAHCLDTLGWEFPVPAINLELLVPLGEKPAREVQMDFFTVVTSYHALDPPLSDPARVALAVGLCLHYADSYIALETALWLKGHERPVAMVALALAEIASNGLGTPVAVRGAQLLLSSLLDGQAEVRQVTVAWLRNLGASDPYQEVLKYVRPQLEVGELD